MPLADKCIAIILCSPTVRLYLINYARPLIYTTFMSYPSLVAIKVSYDWLESGKTQAVSTTSSAVLFGADVVM